MKLVVKPDMLFGKRGKSGLVALNLDLAQVRQFVKERLGNEVLLELTFSHAFPARL
jgi:ATP citrate (pro-S)-lyase